MATPAQKETATAIRATFKAAGVKVSVKCGNGKAQWIMVRAKAGEFAPALRLQLLALIYPGNDFGDTAGNIQRDSLAACESEWRQFLNATQTA